MFTTKENINMLLKNCKINISFYFSLILLFYGINAAGQTTPEVLVKKRIQLSDFPSASGIEFLNNAYYITGDDASYVYVADSNFKCIQRIDYMNDYDYKSQLAGKDKFDFESITTIRWGKDIDLMIMGSGSGPKREKAIRLDYDGNDIHKTTYNLSKFYKLLKNKCDINSKELNMEGSAVWKDNLILLNRGTNEMIMLKIKDFREYLKDDDHSMHFEHYTYNLPSVNGQLAKFSGCYIIPDENMLLFSASIENEPDWISQKEIIASYIGFIDLTEPQNNVPLSIPVKEKGRNISDKLESVVIYEKEDAYINLYGTTDNDNGHSEILQIEIRK